MQEGIGLAHMMRIPVVIVNSQRVGPSTGMPTLAAQSDILQAYHGTHGDFVSIAFYPNSVEECYKYAVESFNAAEEAKCPVYLLTDGLLSHLFESVDLDAVKISLKQRALKPLGHESRHFTGLLSKEGIPKTKTRCIISNGINLTRKSCAMLRIITAFMNTLKTRILTRW